MTNLRTANVEAVLATAPRRRRDQLTAREAQIIDLLVKGCNSREIANQLGVKFYTVTSHLKNIYKKFNVHNRAAMVAKTLTEGLLPNHHGSQTTLPAARLSVINPQEPFVRRREAINLP